MSLKFLRTGLILVLPAVFCWGKIPAVVFNISADSSGFVFIVDKQKQVLLVAKSPAPQQLHTIREFRITTGKEAGDKRREGDQRTPEGIYYVTGQVPEKKLTPKYGPAAFILDYPNFVDKLDGRNGSNIWIHGRDEAIRDWMTEGCISLDNQNLLLLSRYIHIPQTAVIICDELNPRFYLDEAAYQKELTQWERFLTNWAQAWRRGLIDEYVDYYAPDFRDEGGRDRQHFKAYKADLEKRYAWKDVRLEKVLVLTSQQETHVRFVQKYQSPTFYSEGWKKLILIPTHSGWKIVYEKFSPIRPRQSTTELITGFVQQWLKAWEQKDLNAYLSCYSPDFSSDGYDYQGWRQYKSELFKTLDQIKIEYTQLVVELPQPFTYVVTFKQTYQANGYRDVGIKKLTIVGPADRLQITKEEWEKTN